MSSLRQSHAIFHRIVVKTLQERVAPLVLLCCIEKKKKNMPDLSTNTYILELCVSSLHKGHAKCLKSLTCHHRTKNRGHATLLPKKNSMYVSSLHKGPCKISLRKKKNNVQLTPCRREIVIPAKDHQYSADRRFRDIRTFGRAGRGFQRFAPQKHYGRPLRL